ncbi:NAD(P)H-binding protein [Streptomyces bobili]|uniref:SDR family oxidoreductase n=1 Tax=Streptomyces bobili TaxID=67280 RepID=UPI0033B90306
MDRSTTTSRPTPTSRRSEPPVTTLVVGATGRLGPHIVKAVDAAGRPVSALVRDPVRAAGILPSAARVVVEDFTRPDTLDRALEGVEAMVLLTPHGPSTADVQINLVARAADAGVRVVKISGTSTGIRPDGPEACRRLSSAPAPGMSSCGPARSCRDSSPG